MIEFKRDLRFAADLDERDPFRSFRSEFFIPKLPSGKELFYFAGNSLGLQPKSAKSFLLQELEDWEKFGVDGHFEAANPWVSYHELVTEDSSRLVGAKSSEVVMMNTLTVNLHLMMVTFYRPTPDRYKIMIEDGAFPSDRHAVDSQLKFHGFTPETSLITLRPRAGEHVLRTEDILKEIDKEGPSVALIMLGGVNYYTGQVFDMSAISKAAQKNGCKIGYDLAHAVGNVELNLHDWNVDFGVWCSYKYLNAGPGGPGGCYIHERHHRDRTLPRFEGWWGNDKKSRFQMSGDFVPIESAEAWQLSNPSIFAMAPLRASLEIFRNAEMDHLRAKSKLLTGYLEFLLTDSKHIEIITPRAPDERGAQLSLFVKNGGKSFHNRLNDAGFICDWREPNVIRAAPAPLYNTFTDVFHLAEFLNNA